MLGGVFISYRREDSGGFAGRIYDRLADRLGHDNVFFDVDAIPPGRDFVDVLSDRVGKCDALIAVIGKHWVSGAEGDNRRRLEDPNDFVRIEIEAALRRNVPVIPVLVDGAAMPQAADLPGSLQNLVRRQAVEISLTRFDSDAERLTQALSQIEGDLSRRESPEAAGGSGATAAAQGAAAAPEGKVGRPPALYIAIVALGALAVAGAAALLLGRGGTRPADQDASAGEWLTREDFAAELKKQSGEGNYPDKISGRCENGSVKISAHWAPRPQGARALFFGLNDEGFSAKSAELAGQGYALKYDNIFKDCDGHTRHQALWMSGP